MGVITSVTLACQLARPLWAREWQSTLAEVLPRLEIIARESDLTSLAWVPATGTVVVRAVSLGEPPPGHVHSGRTRQLARKLGDHLYGYLAGGTVYSDRGFAGFHRALGPLTVGPALDLVGGTNQILSPGGFLRRLAAEYALPREHAAAAVAELDERIRRDAINIHSPVALRFGPAETGWLAPAHGRETCYLNFLVHRPYGSNTRPVRQFHQLEAILRGYGARPKWAKNHTYSSRQLSESYPRWNDFQVVRRKLDPGGRFLNRYLRQLFDEPEASVTG